MVRKVVNGSTTRFTSRKHHYGYRGINKWKEQWYQAQMTMREQLTEAVGKPHLSYSSLKYALGDMRLWEMYMRGQLKKESDALHFGSLYDLLLFEPEKFQRCLLHSR